MQYEQLAIERRTMQEEIKRLKNERAQIEADFAECARTMKSPCYFCVNHNTCDYQICNFKWQAHTENTNA